MDRRMGRAGARGSGVEVDAPALTLEERRGLDEIRRQIDAEFDNARLGEVAANGGVRRARWERRRARRGHRAALFAGWLVAFFLGAATGGAVAYLAVFRFAPATRVASPPAPVVTQPAEPTPVAPPVEPPPAEPRSAHDDASMAQRATSTEALTPSRSERDVATPPTLPPRPLRPPPRSGTNGRGGQP